MTRIKLREVVVIGAVVVLYDGNDNNTGRLLLFWNKVGTVVRVVVAVVVTVALVEIVLHFGRQNAVMVDTDRLPERRGDGIIRISLMFMFSPFFDVCQSYWRNELPNKVVRNFALPLFSRPEKFRLDYSRSELVHYSSIVL